MKKKMTPTDKLLISAIVVSFITALLHTTIPTVVCSAIHIGITVVISAIHIKESKKEADKALAKTEMI